MSVHVDLSKISDLIKNYVLEKNVNDKLLAKVNSIDTSAFVLKTRYDIDKSEVENRIPDPSGLAKKTDYNSKITEIESKIPSISDLATNAALTTAENKIPNISSIIEKKLTDHNHDKYIISPEFNTLAADICNARLAQENLITKTDFDAKLSSFNRIITANS